MRWRSSAAGLQLDGVCIDIWRSRLDLPEAEIAAYAATLCPQEQARAAKFSFPDKYAEFVVTRGLLRRALALVLERSPDLFRFEYTAGRKPYLVVDDANQRVSFNVSHSHGQALVAMSLARNIGVDIEKIRDKVEYEKLAKRFFSAAEYEALMECPASTRVQAFYATWTRKEAIVKAIGEGIAFGLGEFDVNVRVDETPRVLATRWDPAAAAHWQLASIDSAAGYLAAVASDGGDFSLRLWEAPRQP